MPAWEDGCTSTRARCGASACIVILSVEASLFYVVVNSISKQKVKRLHINIYPS